MIFELSISSCLRGLLVNSCHSLVTTYSLTVTDTIIEAIGVQLL